MLYQSLNDVIKYNTTKNKKERTSAILEYLDSVGIFEHDKDLLLYALLDYIEKIDNAYRGGINEKTQRDQ